MSKYTLLVPIAGAGTRMNSSIPKPLILAGHKTILDWGMDSIDYSECDITFVILREHSYNFSLDKILEQKYPGCKVVQLDTPTGGAVETCLAAKEHLKMDKRLIIFCPDVAFWPRYKPELEHFDSSAGLILTFKANSTNYSYVLKDDDGNVTETREKVIISQEAAVGVYCFSQAMEFFEHAEDMVLLSNHETYICPLYNHLISDNHIVRTLSIEAIHIMGTASELAFFESVVYPYMEGPSEFVLCADHSGYTAKEAFKLLLEAEGLKYVDCGCFTLSDCDYHDYLQLAQHRVCKQQGSYGIGFCRTGQGMNIAANKVLGIRSALVHSAEYARLAVQHNAANFFALPSGQMDIMVMQSIIASLRTARFEGGRHQNRLQKIEAV